MHTKLTLAARAEFANAIRRPYRSATAIHAGRQVLRPASEVCEPRVLSFAVYASMEAVHPRKR